MNFLKVFQHLLPNAKAWRITAVKQLRELFEGLSGLGEDIKEHFDLIWSDIDPSVTRELPGWLTQFGISAAGLSEAQQRAKIDAAWKATGGQSPRYLQDTLQANGFDVYVHDWWEPGTEPAVGVHAQVTPRNPLTYLVQTYPGDSAPPDGYPLVNKLVATKNNLIVLFGEPTAEFGEPTAEFGNFDGFTETRRPYTIPTDPAYWPFFVYIGGETFGDQADVDITRREEFEALCLKLCPMHLWIGILADYKILPPSAPTLTAESWSTSQILLRFNYVGGAGSYNIYWSTSPGVTTSTGTLISEVTFSPHVHTGLTTGTPYYYIITSVGIGGESEPSGEVSAFPLPVPAIPENVVAEPGDESVALTWDPVEYASQYLIYWGSSPGVTLITGTLIQAVITSPEFTDRGLANGATYYYIVVALNSSGQSDISNEVSATPVA